MSKGNGFHSANFSDQDLIKALREARTPEHSSSDLGMSSKELMARLNLGISALMIRLREEVECGNVLVGTRMTRSITGTKCRTPVYRLVEKLKPRKAKK